MQGPVPLAWVSHMCWEGARPLSPAPVSQRVGQNRPHAGKSRQDGRLLPPPDGGDAHHLSTVPTKALFFPRGMLFAAPGCVDLQRKGRGSAATLRGPCHGRQTVTLPLRVPPCTVASASGWGLSSKAACSPPAAWAPLALAAPRCSQSGGPEIPE